MTQRSLCFSVVVPVYDAWIHARRCLDSVLTHCTKPFELIVVDDGSANHSAVKLSDLSQKAGFRLIRHEQNKGYLKSVNEGIAAASGDIVLLLNSDATLHQNSLERLEAGFSQASEIGVVNPVSVWANWTRVPFPAGTSIMDVEEAVSAYDCEDPIIDIHNASGFCFAARRELFDELGLFDSVYDPGYWEETDFCMKALAAGHRVVADLNLFVYHHGWGSFRAEGRDRQMQANRKVFMQRWAAEFDRYETWFKQAQPMKGLSQHVEAYPARRRKDDRARRYRGCHRSGGLAVTYILPSLRLYGGVISVLQLVNELVWRGASANIATAGEVDEGMQQYMPLSFRPHQFENDDCLVEDFPPSDVIVATHWSTVALALRVQGHQPWSKLVYFVQDFEPDFYPKNDPLGLDAELTYRLIQDQIVKTPWLRDRLRPYRGNVSIIPLGLNLDLFHDRQQDRRLSLVAMGRPGSDRRNWPTLVRVYDRIHKERPDVALRLYGYGYDPATVPGLERDYGSLRTMEDVAAMLNENAIALDCSTFQGFGRPGLEAMACGTAGVLTRHGGITSYAKHEYNCLLIDPMDVDGIVESIKRLADDHALRATLVKRGSETASCYCHRLEAQRTIDLFDRLIDQPSLVRSRNCSPAATF